MLTVTGTVLSSEGRPLGGRLVVASPRPATFPGGTGDCLAKTAADGTFTLSCVKGAGVVYAVQTDPERHLPAGIELRCDDYVDGVTVALADLPITIPPTAAVASETVSEIKAELLAVLAPGVSAAVAAALAAATVDGGTP